MLSYIKDTQNGNKLEYYEDCEIINNDFIKLMSENESKDINKLINKIGINCFSGEKKIFIYLQDSYYIYHYLDIGHLEQNIFTTDFIIYFSDKNLLEKFISIIKLESFDKIVKPHLKDIQEKNISQILDDKGQKLGKILKIKDLSNYIKSNNKQSINEISNANLNINSIKLLKLIIYYNLFINRIKNSINEKKIYSGYLIKKEFMNEIYKLGIYNYISNYINSNQKIKKLLKENQEKDYNILYQIIIKEFEPDIIKNINKMNEQFNIYAHLYEVNFTPLKLNLNNLAYIPSNYFILNDELYKLFSYSESYCNKDITNYFYEKKRLFIYSDKYHYKNSVLMYHLNNNNELEIKIIFYLFNPNNRDDCIRQIKEIGYDQYQGYLLFDEEGLVSPIFDQNQNQIGNAYKYNSSINDYSKYNISFEIRKIFYLYLNYQILLKKPKIINDNKFKEYYAVNTKWMQKYKEYFNYYNISAVLDKNDFIQMIFNNILTNAQNTNFHLNDKLIVLMMKQIPKNYIDEFIKKDRCFSSFRAEEMKIPNISHINYNGNNTLLYYKDFELISKDIYEYLFNCMSNYYKNNESFESKAEMVECIFNNKYIVINISNPNDKKFTIEVGNTDSNNIFNPEFFFLYDEYKYLCEHVQNIINSGGFNEYCETFKSLPINTLDIKGNQNQRYGIAIKKNINPNYNMNINQLLSKTNIMNNNQYTKLEHKKNLHIKEGQNMGQQLAEYKPKLSKHLNEMFPWPPRVGLDNIGATCYMNAIIQCFGQIEKFVLFFKYDKRVNEVINKFTNEKKECLTTSFKILIEKTWPDEAMQNESKERHIPPREFRKKIADMSPLFVDNQVNEVKDFANFIIMTLHEELNESKKDNNMNNPMITCLNNNNKQLEIFQIFYEYYKRTFSSKISELFYAIQQIKTQCLNCNAIQYNYQEYFLVVFPLEEVKKYAINKINSINSNNMNVNIILNNSLNPIPLNNNMNPNFIKLNKLNNDIVNIMDCFDYYQRIEYFKEDNKMYCNNCNNLSNFNYNITLTTAPKVLILILNRGVGIQYKIKLEFATELDITNYVTQKNGKIKYKLIGVITYFGESAFDGHFIAHCLSPIDNEWYTYDDAIVSKIDDFQKQIIDLGMPYLLFYKMIE